MEGCRKYQRKEKLAKNGRRYILMVCLNISYPQATSDASADTFLGSNISLRSCEFHLSANSLSKEPSDGSDARARLERRSRFHRKPIYPSSRGIVRFVLVLYECEERHHFRYWRSRQFRGFPSPPGGDHNLRANCPVRLWRGHADRHYQRPLSGPFIEHDKSFLLVLAGTLPVRRQTRS